MASYLGKVERGVAQPSRALVDTLERALELRMGALFTRLGQPPLDIAAAFLAPEPVSPLLGESAPVLREWDGFLQSLVNEAMQRLRAKLKDRFGEPETPSA